MTPSKAFVLYSNRRKTTAGFTLIEMLVALAVVAVALAAISSSYINSLEVTDGLRERTVARWIAENHLVKRQLETPWPATGTRQGSLQYTDREWSWEETIEPSPDKDFRRISIEVRKKNSSYIAAAIVAYARNPEPTKLAQLK